MTRPIILGKLHNDLYFADVQYPGFTPFITTLVENSGDVHMNNASACIVVDNNAKLWHLRMRHHPFSQLKHVFPDMNVKHDMDCICQI